MEGGIFVCRVSLCIKSWLLINYMSLDSKILILNFLRDGFFPCISDSKALPRIQSGGLYYQEE
jgi:hypothetical protein